MRWVSCQGFSRSVNKQSVTVVPYWEATAKLTVLLSSAVAPSGKAEPDEVWNSDVVEALKVL